MLNLLPPDVKQAYRYARINRHLVHWITVFSIGIVGAVVITSFGYLYLDQQTKSYATQVENTGAQLAAQNLTGVQNQVKEISNNLKLVVDVLSEQILFSGLLNQLSTLLPNNTKLTGLSISQTQGALDISAAAKSYEDATQVQINLSDPNNELFSKADIININCSAGTSDYPCTILIRALFSQNNPYMFTHNTLGKSR